MINGVLFTLMALTTPGKQVHEQYVILKNAEFDLIIEDFFVEHLDFYSIPENEDVYLTYWGSSPKAQIKYDGAEIFISYHQEDIERVFLKLGERTKSISFVIQGDPVHYDDTYIKTHRGNVTVEIPEVYELTNVLLALSDAYHGTQYQMNVEGPYYADMLKWFEPYKDHAIFKALNGVGYYGFVENGPGYVFFSDQIVNSDLYCGFRAKNEIEPLIPQLTDFAKKTHFRTFFKQHRPYYASLKKSFLTRARPKDIWNWLESEFPERYQGYKVIFSPLGGGRHSARMYESNGFKEAIMLISGPNRYDSGTDSQSIQSKKMSRSFFTEIDHAYVNPISEKYIDEINSALPDLKPWYRGNGYNKPFLTFNEYMTWSLFSLFAMDHYSAQDYHLLKEYVEKFMVNKKGFSQFKPFNRELTSLYKHKSKSQTIPDLYPLIIQWMKDYSTKLSTNKNSH